MKYSYPLIVILCILSRMKACLHFRPQMILWISLFTLTILACGVPAHLPTKISTPASVKIQAQIPTQTLNAFPYSATVNTQALNVRTCAGTVCQIDHVLPKGAPVTVYETKEIDDPYCPGLWARIDGGLWVCRRFLNGN